MRRGNSWVRYFGLAIVLYMVFTVGRLAYRNYELNMQEENLRTDIASLENEIQELNNQIVYFQSDAYKEKMIRAKLGMKKEGEEVVVITPSPEAEEVTVTDEEENRTNPERWLSYLFPG
ncbi:MAG: septum formation initiator family protein [Patescibacteria group bacterium]|nr:septum formation initiator family protein [Patescibacteria group bacterium]